MYSVCTYQTATVDRTNIINKHFQSTFTPVSPLRLSHLSESTVLDGLADGTITENTVPETFRPKVPEMPPSVISLAAILKMLAGLDPRKASGPDTIKPIVLRSLKDQAAPMLQIIFQNH